MDKLWNGAKYLVDLLSLSVEGGYAVVASQDTDSVFYGRICVKENNYYYYPKDSPTNKPFFQPSNSAKWGNALIFQTR